MRPPLKRGEGVRSVETAFVSHAGSARVRVGRTELAPFENLASDADVAARYEAWVGSYFSRFVEIADASADAGALADGAAATSWGFYCGEYGRFAVNDDLDEEMRKSRESTMRGRKHTAAHIDLTDAKGKAKVVYVVYDGVNPPEEFCEDEEAVQRK